MLDYTDNDAFRENRRFLYRTLYKIGGRNLIQELNEIGCEWCDEFKTSKIYYASEALDYAFFWKESTQGFEFWQAMYDIIIYSTKMKRLK